MLCVCVWDGGRQCVDCSPIILQIYLEMCVRENGIKLPEKMHSVKNTSYYNLAQQKWLILYKQPTHRVR